jgi:uncharacterized protein YkwD
VKPRAVVWLGIAVLVVAGPALRRQIDVALVRDAEGCAHSSDMPKPDEIETTRTAILCLLNAQRAKHGLPALRQNALLELASQAHSDDMAERKYFEHETPEGVDPGARMTSAGYGLSWTGENIYAGVGARGTPVEAVDGWMHSPGHRANILRPQFTEVGVGVAYDFPDADVTAPAGVYTTDFGGS